MLSESSLLDSVVVVSDVVSEALLVRTEAVSEAVASVELVLVLVLLLSSVVVVAVSEVSISCCSSFRRTGF